MTSMIHPPSTFDVGVNERGLLGYNTFRSVCGLKKAITFDQPRAEIPAPLVDKLAKVCSDPEEVDIFVVGTYTM